MDVTDYYIVAVRDVAQEQRVAKLDGQNCGNTRQVLCCEEWLPQEFHFLPRYSKQQFRSRLS
jgi:hypothetical protein